MGAAQAAVDETDHPLEALIRVGVSLEPARGLQHGEAVHGAADEVRVPRPPRSYPPR
jgi:hypothetical protein